MQNKDDVNRPCFAYISKLLNWGKCRSRNLNFFKLLKTAKKCPHLADIIISFELNWEECRSHNLNFFKLLKTAKRGFLGFEISTDSYI